MQAEPADAGNLFQSEMRRVNQTKFSIFFADGKRLTYGNCLVACVASILDERIDEVPNFYTFYGLDPKEDRGSDDPMWMRVLNLWLEAKHGRRISVHGMEIPPTEKYIIMRGKSLRGQPHCCIFRNELGDALPFFDPHPTSQFLKDHHYYYQLEKI